MIDSFTECSSLDWHLWSFRVCWTSIQALPTFRVSTEELGVNIMNIYLYITWSLSLKFLVYFLCSVNLTFWLLCILGGSLSGPLCLECGMSPVPWCQAHVQPQTPPPHPSHPDAWSDYWSLARLGRGNGAQKGGAKSRSRAAASSMRRKIPSWLCQWIAHLYRVDKGHSYPSKNGGLGL